VAVIHDISRISFSALERRATGINATPNPIHVRKKIVKVNTAYNFLYNFFFIFLSKLNRIPMKTTLINFALFSHAQVETIWTLLEKEYKKHQNGNNMKG